MAISPLAPDLRNPSGVWPVDWGGGPRRYTPAGSIGNARYRMLTQKKDRRDRFGLRLDVPDGACTPNLHFSRTRTLTASRIRVAGASTTSGGKASYARDQRYVRGLSSDAARPHGLYAWRAPPDAFGGLSARSNMMFVTTSSTVDTGFARACLTSATVTSTAGSAPVVPLTSTKSGSPPSFFRASRSQDLREETFSTIGQPCFLHQMAARVTAWFSTTSLSASVRRPWLRFARMVVREL
jgi:hypothetical protein